MRRSLTIALSAVLLTACTAREPLSQAVVRSEMQRNPAASYIDGLEGKLKWNYTTGLELKAFLDASTTPGQAGGDVLEYVDAWYDAIIAEDGTIGVNYKKSNYSTDHICPGRTLFQLYDLTGKESLDCRGLGCNGKTEEDRQKDDRRHARYFQKLFDTLIFLPIYKFSKNYSEFI